MASSIWQLTECEECQKRRNWRQFLGFYASISRGTYNGPIKRNKSKKLNLSTGRRLWILLDKLSLMPTRTFKTGQTFPWVMYRWANWTAKTEDRKGESQAEKAFSRERRKELLTREKRIKSKRTFKFTKMAVLKLYRSQGEYGLKSPWFPLET